jgi:hypothetical protein
MQARAVQMGGGCFAVFVQVPGRGALWVRRREIEERAN